MNGLRIFPEFEEVPHKADAAIIAYGHSLSELFSNAALGFYHILDSAGESLSKVEGVIVLQAPDVETLLVSFLTELLYLAEKGIKAEIYGLEINNQTLKVKIYKRFDQRFSNLIKAVTFNELKVLIIGKVFQARIVFDK